MGNAVSCTPSIISGGGAVKVVFPNGNIQMYTKSVKAADLMVENRGQFVCDSGGLKVGFRVHGLTADEELERRRLYFLLPMELLYSVLTEEEMSCLSFPAAKRRERRSERFRRGEVFEAEIVETGVGDHC
ncbi:hypothetical protein V6Z11_A12G311300 [Gossypium hirsutum]